LDERNNYFIYFDSNVSGSEHSETKLNSKSGNINVTSAKGLSISGGNISAQSGQVNLEANGVLAEQYKSSINSGANQPPKSLNASIIIDGHTDFYEKGTESEGNYSFRTLVSPTIINGDKGVNIRTVGKTKDDNLVLQATGITSKNGDVKIESNKSILFDAAIEQSYDLTTTTEKKKSWGGLKKKYITTVSENNDTNAASVDISAKNISIETKKLDPSVAAQTPDNNIDIYSGRFTAEGGTISIKSGGNLNFYTVEESSSSTVDVTKKTSYSKLISLLGSSKTTTNTTRTQISELPANLKADYINTQAVDKTKLVGTEFDYLKNATIETGGTLELIAAKTSITELLKKEKSSLAWQSMQDKGSITETAQLPSFNGPVLPTFKAAGGLSVQVPISEKDANKVELRDAILDLAKQPGNEYLKEFVNRKDVDWQKVLLTQKDWDYKQQGLTAAGAAIIVIIITIVTMGTGTAAAAGAAGGTAASGTTVGLGASMIGSAGVTTATVGGVTTITGVSTLGAMANAAITSLATQAGVSLINNGGDIGKTLKDLGSKDSIKSLATSVVTAGVLSKIASIDQMKALQETTKSGEFFTNLSGRVGQALVNSTVSASVDTAVNGGSLSEKLSASLVAGLSVALQGSLAGEIGENLDLGSKELSDQILHKLAHAAAGCIASSLQEKCEAGAIGAVVGEMVAGSFDMEPENDGDYSQAQLNKVRNVGQLISGVVAASAGYDVTVASQSASTAIENNWGKVLSSTGKAAYKIFKKATELQKAGKNLNDTNVWKDILKDTATGEYQDMLNSFKTAFSAGSTPLERTWALIDLATGIDKKDVKIVQDLLKDRNTIAKRLPNIKNGQFFDDKKIEELANRGDVKKIHQIDVGAKGGWAKQANGKLEANSAYLLPNGAAYVTDNSGNVKEVTTNLRNILMDRNNYQQSIAGKSGISGDQGGHLIAASLGGSGDRINLVPMAKTLNNGSWKAMESELANAVKLGKDVNMKVTVGYPTGSSRPNKFIVTATINGKSTNYQFSQ
jgi:filamentous hemagglutinin